MMSTTRQKLHETVIRKYQQQRKNMWELLAHVVQCQDTLSWTRVQHHRRSSKDWTKQQERFSKEKRRMNSEDRHNKNKGETLEWDPGR